MRPLPTDKEPCEKSVAERLDDIQMRVHAIRGNTKALIEDLNSLRDQLREEGIRAGSEKNLTDSSG